MTSNSWIRCKISDIKAPIPNSLVGGPFGSNLVSRDYTSFGIPVIRGQNMGFGRWVSGEFVFVSSQKSEDLYSNLARPNDLIFTQRGTLGQVAIVPPKPYAEYVISQSQMKLTVDDTKADVIFLYYLFNTLEQQEYIKQNAIQTGVPHTNLEHLRNTPILLPPLSDQHRIAHILGSLDDKIELNRQMNETLEAMARAIFKSWFVAFDPVRAKAEGRDTGLPPDFAALFPDGFEEVDGREVPRGWKIVQLSEIATTQYGYTESASEIPIGPHFLRVMDINKQNWIEWDTVPFCKITDADFEKYQLKIGDIVVARMADPGKSAIIEEDVDAVFASYLVRLRVKSLARAYYIYHFLKSSIYDEYTQGAKSGSVQASMNAKIITGADIILPSDEILESFLKDVQYLRKKIVVNVAESRTLAQIRDALLPKLMSGEINIGNDLMPKVT